jgi:hypothetical protein
LLVWVESVFSGSAEADQVLDGGGLLHEVLDQVARVVAFYVPTHKAIPSFFDWMRGIL